MRALKEQASVYCDRGEDIPPDLKELIQSAAKVSVEIRQGLSKYQMIFESLITPGELPADLRMFFDASALEVERMAAGERILPLIKLPFHPERKRGLQEIIDIKLKEGAQHLSREVALKYRLLSCLSMAKILFNSITVGEVRGQGEKILRHEISRLLPEDLFGPWWQKKSAVVEEAGPEIVGHTLSPDKSIDMEKLLNPLKLTKSERKVLETALKIGSEKPKDIACTLNIPVGRVRVHLHNARRKYNKKNNIS